jgi:iron complex outermembrane recepter protein
MNIDYCDNDLPTKMRFVGYWMRRFAASVLGRAPIKSKVFPSDIFPEAVIRTLLVGSTAVVLAAASFAVRSEETSLSPVDVTAPRIIDSTDSSLGSSSLNKEDIAPMRTSTSDTARLLQDVPGVSLFGAGGISSLPVIHGMADERLNVQVNGMGLMPACPNHMNSPLSYIDPTSVDTIKVYAGVTPVSVGGDSIGGSIQVNSAPPKFASSAQEILLEGALGAFYRSNGNARGGNASATIATEDLNVTYTGSAVNSKNFRAGRAFHAPGSGGAGGQSLDGDVVGSSAFRATNQDVGIALRHQNHFLQLNASEQKVPYEGFPNQRMDLTDNETTIFNLAYRGRYEWGDLDGRIYRQDIKHTMNMGPDRMFGDFPGMPMYTKGKVQGSKLQANLLPSESDTFRLGIETQYFSMYDWWTPIGGQMGPNSFWNIDYGTRNKLGVFGEWEANWNSEWVSLLGVRGDRVKSDAGPVQGYSGAPVWAIDAAAFNARDHKRTFNNLDLTALVRFTPGEERSFELGYARKSRAPSVYQLYPWSTYEMATTMNNFAGDGGGYVGNLDLKQEVAHTLSASGDWHDATRERWGLKAMSYYTRIENYISAHRCNISYCDPNKLTATTGFVALQHVNETARIYGVDLSGNLLLGNVDDFGSFTGTGVLSYLRGKELSTGDNLFNMMPLNAKLALIQRLGYWTNTAEVQLVAAKTHVSQVRNEVKTAGYGLLNLRSSAQLTKKIRLDFAVENALNRYYQHPLGGAYVGQGNTMFLDSLHWGDYVPGMGRSLNAALNASF